MRLVYQLLLPLLLICVAYPGKDANAAPAQQPTAFAQQGKASFYARIFHGRATASGETFDNGELVAAHKTLPMGTRVRVTNLENDRQVIVRINDRGPYVRGRIIDLSLAAARRVDMVEDGTTPVKVERLE